MSDLSRKQRLQAMLQEEPNDPFLRYGLAMEYVSEGADEEAVRCLAALRDVDPNYVPAYLQEGQALIRLGRGPEAHAILDQGYIVAQRQGDAHAAGEMQVLRDSIA